jgi:hypothetical protein
MTLKGSNLHTKNASTFDNNPEGVEFRKLKTIYKTQNLSERSEESIREISGKKISLSKAKIFLNTTHNI